MNEDKKPPIYYVALHAMQATKQANLTQYKRRQAEVERREKLREEANNEKGTKVSEVD